MKVQVYRNSNKNCWSVRHQGKVIEHADKLFLENCKFKVYENGRLKSLQLGHKTLHAYVKGEICDEMDLPNKTEVKYDRHRAGHFFTELGPVEEADFCILTDKKVFISGVQSP
tara:strand:+ start:102 stop:440 length:339 start_codon:yes stop_codon:yes gene_type:complete